MKNQKIFDVIIIGGSYAGLSAAMCLGRSLREVLVIDSGRPCNKPVRYAHNLLSHDGKSPKAINKLAKKDLAPYDTVVFHEGLAVELKKIDGGFEIKTEKGLVFQAVKLIFATGLTDIMPDIAGFSDCWGKTILHCPYCHGYEVRARPTAILGNGDLAYEMVKSISNWTSDLTIFTNGKAVFSESQRAVFKERSIGVVESVIKRMQHQRGQLQALVFEDGSKTAVEVLYAHPHTKQQCELFAKLGCSVNQHGCIDTNVFQQTNTYGVYAAGDCSSVGRAISVAVAAGTVAGIFLNKELIEEAFR